MKHNLNIIKILFFVSLFCLISISCRSVINISDENFRNHLYKNGYIDYDNENNTYITKKGNELTMLDCSNLELKSLKGIEHFKNLEILKCQNNKLTKLNLNNNTKLRILECYQNEIKNINIKGCPELTVIICSDNPLQNVDLRYNTKLQEFTCLSGKLSSINTSNNTDLRILVVSQNRIKSVDVSNNKELKQLALV